MKKIKNSYKIIIAFVLGICISVTSVYAVDAYIESKKVSYDNKYTDKNNAQEAIDELYERSGIHKEKWIDPVLNGADPVLKDPLIPVEIKPNGEVYYANLNSEWYNYSEKRWANAVILVDNPSNKNYKVGDHIKEDDIESYFVWIPRYEYKIWDMGNYDKILNPEDLITNSSDNVPEVYWKLAGGNSQIININFVSNKETKKTAKKVGDYHTHPAFTLGDKELNGIWVGKFETGYKGATKIEEAKVDNEEKDSIIIKPDVYAWQQISVKNIFMTSYNYERDLDSHMLKNTEWGAVTYLSHSEYGIASKVNINNNSEYKTGYSAVAGTAQYTNPGETGNDDSITKKYDTTIGYLASTTGNISGVYDMSGGVWEYVAGCLTNTPKDSGFSNTELAGYIATGYIDGYPVDSTTTTYNKRILGDATGEMGPFYNYIEPDTNNARHSSWYGEYASFSRDNSPWFVRSGINYGGSLSGIFYFGRRSGALLSGYGFRISLAIQ